LPRFYNNFMKIRNAFFLLFSVFAVKSFAQAVEQQKDSVQNLDEVVVSAQQILGSKFQARNRTGSAYYISPQEIQKMGYTDINRMLKAVPGVNVYEEDGYGLRPNISLRGTKAERSEKITLMEDGILAAPAPYSAPAAYYFPNAARMQAVEVVKGSSQVQYGPFTTGGAINMVSTAIPTKFLAKLNATYGTNNTLKSHINVGDQKKYFGYMVEYLRYQSDGFKHFENKQYAGFKRNDLVAKFRVNTAKTEGANHSFELKAGYANEDSNETYVGLTQTDFARTPFLRYVGSQKDQLTTRHYQWVGTYLLQFSPRLKFTTNFYYNTFFRNWYKLESVKYGTSASEKRTIGQILADPETNAPYFDILSGKTDSRVFYNDYERLKNNPGLFVRANYRTYFSRGVQTKAEYKAIWGNCYLDNEWGLRYHTDEEDRNQWDDLYAMKNEQMQLLWKGVQGSQANKITRANALAAYWLSKVSYKKLTVTAGLRFEHIELLEKDYTTADTRRTGQKRIETSNIANAVIPSLGLHYNLSTSLSAFAGVHKGFSPPGVSKEKRVMDRNGNITLLTENQKPESSINIEAGLRVNKQQFKTELIGFYNNYSNMLGSDLAAMGGTGTLEQFNVGEAVVKGAEFIAQYQPFPEDAPLKTPLQLSYTFTDTEMKNSFESNSWGRVVAGDEIPYINRHTLNLSVGATYSRYELNIGIRYSGAVRTEPGQGLIAERHKIPAYTILDASAKAKINNSLTLTVNTINLTNKTYLVSRHPSGLRAGHPFGIFGGIIYKVN